MPTKTPKETIKVRRLPKEGQELTLRAKVTRTGRNSYDTSDTVTVRIAGYDYPITLPVDYLDKLDG